MADSCKDQGIEVLESFNCLDIAPSRTIGKSLAQNECEFYCSSEERCWGCIEVCQEPCKWNAVIDYKPMEYVDTSLVRNITRKTGKASLEFSMFNQVK